MLDATTWPPHKLSSRRSAAGGAQGSALFGRERAAPRNEAAVLGPPKHRHFDRQLLVSLENLVPRDNFYRYVDAKLDLSFIRELVQDRYALCGRPSIDPVVFFRLELILFFEGLRSERKLMKSVAPNLAQRWYAGYDFDEPLPDHSSLTRIRCRLGLPLFQRFFLCRQS